MLRRTVLTLFIALLALPMAWTQDAEANPTVAIFRFGISIHDSTELGVLDMLKLFGYLRDDEYAAQKEQLHDMEGENINLLFADASFDFSNIIPMLERAIDAGADVLLTDSAPVSQAAVNLTADMEEPLPVIFVNVFDPYAAGIAQSLCVKPAHVTGTQRITDYPDLIALMLLQNPGVERIGTIYASASSSGEFGVDAIAAAAEGFGVDLEVAAVVGIPDVAAAAEGLVSKGVEAFIMTVDLMTSQALPIIVQVASDNDIPVYHPNATYSYYGATVAAGSVAMYGPGLHAGHMLVGHLQGEIDLASTSISVLDTMAIAINVDRSRAAGVELPEELLARADFLIEDASMSITPKGMTNSQFLGEIGMLALLYPELAGDSEFVTPELLQMLTQMAFPDPKAQHEAVLASLHCTPEMIAEQQAELDAAAN